MRVLMVLGTRPEIIKLYPVYKELKNRGHWVKGYFTNQNFDDSLSTLIFKDFDYLPQDIIKHPNSTANTVVRKIMHRISLYKPNCILVEGDTWAVMQGTLAGLKTETPIGHVEAGLRSGDLRMVEEKIRIMVDSVADYLFTPTSKAYENIRKELGRNSFMVGNTVYDNLKGQERGEEGGYVLATMHRPETVDESDVLSSTLNGVVGVAEKLGLKLKFLVHPRTADKLGNIKFEPPCGYKDFIEFLKHANLVMTDSGGVQEEAAILKVPCVTLRDNTERPETVAAGLNVLAGHDPNKIMEATIEVLEVFAKKTYDSTLLYGDGQAGKKIVDILEQRL